MRHPEITAMVGSTRSLQRLEGGEPTGLTFPVIGSLCDLYQVPPEEKFELQRLWRLGPDTNWTQPRGRSVFGYEAYRELELQAKTVYQYESTFVPGKLQTENTMRKLFSRNPNLSEAEIDDGAANRLEAQRPFWEESGDRRFSFLLGEAVLRSGCDGEQLDRLVEADLLDHATVRYIPFESGPAPLLMVPFTLLSFPDENDTDIVYVDAQDAFLYFEESESVQRYRTSLESADDQARSIKEFKR
jgi:hypothetical protein